MSDNFDEVDREPNFTSIWTKDNMYDFVSWSEIEKMPKETVEDFYFLLNNDYLTQNGRVQEYCPNEKWINHVLGDVMGNDDEMNDGWI
jgi:hypothetical protein